MLPEGILYSHWYHSPIAWSISCSFEIVTVIKLLWKLRNYTYKYFWETPHQTLPTHIVYGCLLLKLHVQCETGEYILLRYVTIVIHILHNNTGIIVCMQRTQLPHPVLSKIIVQLHILLIKLSDTTVLLHDSSCVELGTIFMCVRNVQQVLCLLKKICISFS